MEYVQGRWQTRCTSVAELQCESEAQRYWVCYSLLMQALAHWRSLRPPPEHGSGLDAAGHAESASMCARCAQGHLSNSNDTSAMHSKTSSRRRTSRRASCIPR